MKAKVKKMSEIIWYCKRFRPRDQKNTWTNKTWQKKKQDKNTSNNHKMAVSKMVRVNRFIWVEKIEKDDIEKNMKE